MAYFLEIDVSTTATKALLIDPAGQVVAVSSTTYPFETPRPLWSEQHPDLWWDGAQKSIRAVLEGVAYGLKDAMIDGHIPPFLLRNGSPEEIKARILDDFRKVSQTGGLTLTTAGSLAAGTGVGRMRWMMQVVQDHCRYD